MDQPLETVRAAERRIVQRLAAAAESRDAVAAAHRDAARVTAAARDAAASTAKARAEAIEAETRQQVAAIRSAADRDARELRAHAAARLDRDADVVVRALLPTRVPPAVPAGGT
jgi:hypothetical protein